VEEKRGVKRKRERERERAGVNGFMAYEMHENKKP